MRLGLDEGFSVGEAVMKVGETVVVGVLVGLLVGRVLVGLLVGRVLVGLLVGGLLVGGSLMTL